AGFHYPDRESSYGSGRTQFIPASRQDHVIESAARNKRGGGRQSKAHCQRNGLLVFIVFGDDLPHVRAGRRLKRAHVAPARVHPVVADVAAAVEILADNDTIAAADRFFGLESCVPYVHYPFV